MFGDPEKVITGAYIKLAYFAPVGTRGMNTADDIIYHDDIHGPLILQADKTIDLLNNERSDLSAFRIVKMKRKGLF